LNLVNLWPNYKLVHFEFTLCLYTHLHGMYNYGCD